MPTTTPGYLVRRLQDAPTVPCPCGQSTRPLTRADTEVCNLHVTFITDSQRHYHKLCTEVYYVLEGRGRMEMHDEDVGMAPGTAVYIEPYTGHCLWRAEGIRSLVVGMP